MNDLKTIPLLQEQTIEIWKQFCTLHTQLYDITCDEYLALLSSDMDKIEECLLLKKSLINEIDLMEKRRSEIIDYINQNLDTAHISKVFELISFFNHSNESKSQSVLEKYNNLLIDIVEKLQDQNKKNRLFLNKALLNISEIKKEFSHKKGFETYNSSGEKTVHSR